jgi:arsenite-transporting ATPase
MVDFPLTQLTLISGKGGVGKTTSACAIALTQAQASPDTQLLLLSTDPAHSLGDVLGITVDDTARSHPDCPNLKLRALDADRLLRHFRSDYGQVLETLVERGSFVDDDDLSPVWDMDWPGLNELMGLLEIQRILRVGEADQVVVDMAPSGHTLNSAGADGLPRHLPGRPEPVSRQAPLHDGDPVGALHRGCGRSLPH